MLSTEPTNRAAVSPLAKRRISLQSCPGQPKSLTARYWFTRLFRLAGSVESATVGGTRCRLTLCRLAIGAHLRTFRMLVSPAHLRGLSFRFEPFPLPASVRLLESPAYWSRYDSWRLPRFGQRLVSDLASPWGGGLDSVSLLIEEYQTGEKSQYESIKKAGQKKDLPSQGYTSIRCP